MEELQKLQRNLEADQKAWVTKKAVLEQEVGRLNTVLDVVAPKVEAAQTELKRVRAEASGTLKSKQDLDRQVSDLNATVTALEASISSCKQTLATLEQLAAEKLRQVDENFAAHRRLREAELVVELREQTAAVTAKTGELATAQADLDQAHRQLTGVLETTAQERATALQERTAAEQTLADLQALVPELEAKKTLLERQFKEASYQLKQVAAETGKARLEHQGFLEYEARARKLLDTKDRELQDKRDELEVTARHVGNRRSYLSEL